MAPFRYLLRARYPECDAQGIVFNARYGDWTDLATTELLRAIDPANLEPGGVDYRLRKQETEWRAPARFDDVIAAEVRVTAMGTTSFTVETVYARVAAGPFTPADAPAELVSVRTVYVLVDASTGEKRAIPPAFGERLRIGAPGRVTDHAGVGGGRVTQVARWADRTTMPWKNGRGVTHELVRAGEGVAGFAVRISIAEVATDGPFSAFPEVDRVIVLLEGAGMRIARTDGVGVTLRAGEPYCFHGEDAYTGALTDGPVHDFNVMVDRVRYAAAVTPVGPGIVAGTWLLARAAGRVGGVGVARWDLAELDGAVLSEVPGLLVTLTRRAGA